jgi:D-alanyl-D-alanine carboxypeptidase/D-alanyl-D-alanine-endopeptidase (penicillin-binding protein 4)
MTTLFSTVLLASAIAQAAPPVAPAKSSTTQSVQSQFNRIRGGSNSAFCYAIDDGTVQGINQDRPVKIASVMKVLTTFWAVEKLGPNYRFRTRIYIQAGNKEMHVEGARDPFFDRQRLFLLLADLNKLGFKDMNRVTFDENFRFDMQALDFTRNPKYAHTEAHVMGSLAARDIKTKMSDALNTAQWAKDRKVLYTQVAKHSASPTFPAGVVFKAASVDVVPSNPLAGKPGVKVYDVESAPLKMYLKEMNILSINPIADEMFATLGGADSFRAFMKEKYGMGTEFAGVYSGSGLPTHGVRHDTTVSCSAVVRLIRRMDLDLESKYKLDLADVMMISGTDVPQGATFSDGSRALIVKTGTVNGAKNLAGVEETSAGEVYFGIFLQGAAAHPRNMRPVLSKMMMNFRAKRIEAGPLKFDPLDTEMQIKPAATVPAVPAAMLGPIVVPPLLRKP